MKKILFGLVLMALSFLTTLTVFADGSLMAAGKKVLAEKEQVLIEMQGALNTYVLEIVSDRVATGEEMIALNTKVDDFIKVKSEADKYLKFYGLKTDTALDEDLVKAVKNYYNEPRIFRKDKDGDTRFYFVRLTGEDIVVLRSGTVIAGGQVALIVFAICFLAAFIWSLRLTRDESLSDQRGAVILATIICGMAFIAVIIPLFA